MTDWQGRVTDLRQEVIACDNATAESIGKFQEAFEPIATEIQTHPRIPAEEKVIVDEVWAALAGGSMGRVSDALGKLLIVLGRATIDAGGAVGTWR